jgi:hypothetical protein
MSSSDEESHKAVKKGGKSKSGSKSSKGVEYQIKPSSDGPSMDTSNWPLLLKVIKPNIYNILLCCCNMQYM